MRAESNHGAGKGFYTEEHVSPSAYREKLQISLSKSLSKLNLLYMYFFSLDRKLSSVSKPVMSIKAIAFLCAGSRKTES